MLSWDTPYKKVLEEFPMLEGMNIPELILMKHGCEDIEEDAPFVRAIDILLKHSGDDDAFGSRTLEPVV